MLKIIPPFKNWGEHRKSLISWKDKFLENTDKYIAVLYIGSNTGRNQAKRACVDALKHLQCTNAEQTFGLVLYFFSPE